MKKRLRLTIVLFTAISMLFMLGLSLWWLTRYQEKEIVNHLEDVLVTTDFMQLEKTQDFEVFASEFAAAMGGGIRVTVISLDGNVLGDSGTDASTMENHAGREEILQAAQTGVGHGSRLSATTGIRTIYAAKEVGGLYLRLSMPVSAIYDFIRGSIAPMLVFYFLLLILIFNASRRIAASFVRPFASLGTGAEDMLNNKNMISVDDGGYEELDPIVRNLREMGIKLRGYIMELGEKSNQIESILSAMNDGAIVLDRDMNIILINPKAKTLFPGDTSRNFEGVCRDAGLLRQVSETISKGLPSMAEIDMEDISGRIYNALISPAKGEGAVIFISDVTEIRHLERMRNDFVANVSHELKTPLTSIKGFSELMQADLVTDEKKKKDYLKRITSESERLITLINDILRLSELEREETTQAQVEPVDLRAVAQEATDILEMQARERSVMIDLSGKGAIMADTDRIREMTINLIDNAIKYNKPGGQVHISIQEDSGTVTLKVSDSGIGISEEHQDRIFERFYRVDSARSRKSGGTGLGLSIVKHTAELFGGQVALQSREGQGTTVTVMFPLISR